MSRAHASGVLSLLSIVPLMLCCAQRERAVGPDAMWYPEEVLSVSERREEASQKIARLAKFLRRENLCGILISTAPNFAWITAGAVNTTPDGGPVLAIFIREDGRKYLIGSETEVLRLSREDLDGFGYETRCLPWAEAGQKRVEATVREIAGDRPYASDASLDGARPAGREMTALRVPLTEFEIRKYRWLGKRCAEVVGDACRRIGPGMTERGIEALLWAGLMRQAIRPVAARVAADTRTREFGGAPASEKAKMEGSVLVGVTAGRWGLTVRMARQISFGPLAADMARAMSAVSSVNAGFWARTLPGATAGAILEGAGEDYARSGIAPHASPQGGATGYLEYDWLARPGSTEPVRSGQTFAWNPAAGPVSVEDTILVTGDQLEVLTEIRGWPVIESRSLGRVYRTPAILVR